jgi:DNA-binding NarL/FixJ family response regulator
VALSLSLIPQEIGLTIANPLAILKVMFRSPEVMMSIRVLLADGSDVMRLAIVRVLKEEPLIKLVGEATNFAETLQLSAALKPDVLLLDPHMPDEREYPAVWVKPQVLLNTKCVVAISFWNDADARDLAETFGATALLDKTKLYSELIPAIIQFCPQVVIPVVIQKITESFSPQNGLLPRLVGGEVERGLTC